MAEHAVTLLSMTELYALAHFLVYELYLSKYVSKPLCIELSTSIICFDHCSVSYQSSFHYCNKILEELSDVVV